MIKVTHLYEYILPQSDAEEEKECEGNGVSGVQAIDSKNKRVEISLREPENHSSLRSPATVDKQQSLGPTERIDPTSLREIESEGHRKSESEDQTMESAEEILGRSGQQSSSTRAMERSIRADTRQLGSAGAGGAAEKQVRQEREQCLGKAELERAAGRGGAAAEQVHQQHNLGQEQQTEESTGKRPREQESIESNKRMKADGDKPSWASESTTRSGRQSKPPRWMDDYVLMAEVIESSEERARKQFVKSVTSKWHAEACVLSVSVIEEPATLTEAYESPQYMQWKRATDTEFKSLIDNQTWELVPFTPGMKVLKSKWVLRIKYNADGTIERYKARLVIKGYLQEYGIDYLEVFAPVVRFESLRFLLTYGAVRDYEMDQMDVTTAFLNGPIDVVVFMEQPEGYVDSSKPRHVCRLKKSLYGLKQAPRVWYKMLREWLEKNGFTMLQTEACVGVKFVDGFPCFISIYVDDLILFAPSTKIIKQFKIMLAEKFKMKDLGPIHYILGWEIQRDRKRREIKISQHKYTKKILEKFKMDKCNGTHIPAKTDLILSKALCASDPDELQLMREKPYRAIVGSLMYLMLGSRPDIAFAVRECSQFLENPGIAHWRAVKTILRYIKQTSDYGLILGGNQFVDSPLEHHMVAFCDSDFASHEDRRSIAGYTTFLGESLISWCSQAEKTVALHTTEAEYISLSMLVQEIIHLRMMVMEMLRSKPESTLVFVDNASALKLAKNPEFHARTKHIDVRHHFVREKQDKNEIRIESVSSAENIADMFTKALPRSAFEKHRDALRVRDVRSEHP